MYTLDDLQAFKRRNPTTTLGAEIVSQAISGEAFGSPNCAEVYFRLKDKYGQGVPIDTAIRLARTAQTARYHARIRAEGLRNEDDKSKIKCDGCGAQFGDKDAARLRRLFGPDPGPTLCEECNAEDKYEGD